MRRLLKLLGYTAGALAIAVVGAIALVFLMPRDKVAGIVADEVRKATGREVELSGELSPSLWPVLGVSTGPLRIANAKWGEAPHLLTAADAEIGVEIMPLLSGDVVISELRLIDPVAALEINAAGEANWTLDGDGAADGGPGSGAGGGGGAGSALERVSLPLAEMRNGTVTFSDARTGRTVEIRELDLDAGFEGLDAPVTAEGSGLWNGRRASVALAVETPRRLMAGEAAEVALRLDGEPGLVGFEGTVAPRADGLPDVVGKAEANLADLGGLFGWLGIAPPDPALAEIGALALKGDVEVSDSRMALAAAGSTVFRGRTVSFKADARGAPDWPQTRAGTLDIHAVSEGFFDIAVKGPVALAGEIPEFRGKVDATLARTGPVLAWATGAPAPDAAAELGATAFAGDVLLGPDRLRAAGKGHADWRGRRVAFGVEAATAADWRNTQRAKLDLSAERDGLFEASFSGPVELGGDLPTLRGKFTAAVANPSAAAAWATGAPADPVLAEFGAIAAQGSLRLADGGVELKARGDGRFRGEDARVTLNAKGGKAWRERMAANLDVSANVPGLVRLTFEGPVQLAGEPSARGALDLDIRDLPALVRLAGAGPLGAPPGTLRSAAVKGDLAFRNDRVTLSKAALRVDDTALSGRVGAELGGARPMVTAALNAGDLDLSPFLGGPGEAGGGRGGGRDSDGWSTEPIDLSGLSAVDADVSVQAKSVRLGDLRFGPSDVQATLRGGKLDLDIRRAAIYGGAVQGRIGVTAGRQSAITSDLTVQTVKLRPLLNALAGVDVLEGLGAMRLKASGQGRSMSELMNSLDGQGGLDLTDGAILGINLAALVRNLTGGGTGPERTDFSSVTGTFDIENGVLTNTDFAFLGPLLRIVGEGTVDLGGQSQNFVLTPKAVASLAGQGGALDAAGLGIFPVRVTGTWSNPRFVPDLSAAITNIARDPQGVARSLGGAVDSIRSGDVAGAVLGTLGGGRSADGDQGAAGDPVTGAIGGILDAARGGRQVPEADGARPRDPAADALGTLLGALDSGRQNREPRARDGAAGPDGSLAPRRAPLPRVAERGPSRAVRDRDRLRDPRAERRRDEVPLEPDPAPPRTVEDEAIRAIGDLLRGLGD